MESEHPASNASFWQRFFGPNFGYLLELYDTYKDNPGSVSVETREMFEKYGDPNLAAPVSIEQHTTHTASGGSFVSPEIVVRVNDYARKIREFGHLAAATDPMYPPAGSEEIEAAARALTEADLERVPASVVDGGSGTAKAAVERLRAKYCGAYGYEFTHLSQQRERDWLQDQIEHGDWQKPLSSEEAKYLYRMLAETELFEKFLHRRFAGQKRFSVEGLDVLVPMVDTLASDAVKAGFSTVVIGMAHRGRLNVLAHVMKKPYERIFSEFHSGNELANDDEFAAYMRGWGGDVKYHQGWQREFVAENGKTVRYVLANNPSHLEVVDPVIEGMARAAQEDRTHAGLPIQDVERALPILVHGDAAFPGEGVVSETMNLSQIPGYYTGGTVHIIANNHVGFTADPDQGRSTRYASDLAKGFDMPIVHVSADNPEACIGAIRLAFAYREAFHKDFMIDLIGYRRWGHNESDDPSMTQPVLYAKVATHPTVKELYAGVLQARGVMDAAAIEQLDESINAALMEAYRKYPNLHDEPKVDDFEAPSAAVDNVSIDTLRDVNRALLETPTDFHTYPKLRRILDRRANAIDDGDIDWAHAETLAFATILREGTPIRLTGQDSERGTFGQRHLVLHDVNDGHKYTPLQHLPGAKASFVVYNSPLSETSVIGFEYGYNVFAPETLVLWEAQFGDFVNVAQPMIDQFLAAGRAKWGESSGLVLLLPHGFEGQASEHSSGRVERFLQLAARNNMFVTNVTTAAQYYHLLRLQAARLGSNARPLVVMTPKSLLRNPYASSKGVDLANGQFQTVLHDDSRRTAKKVTRLILSSGKVGVDLAAEIDKRGGLDPTVATARLEQLYPFPGERLQEIFAHYENLQEIVWLQEEPQNAGAWSYAAPRITAILPERVTLRYVGRPEQAFVAEGSPDVHNRVQAEILAAALAKD
ncbi:2-oxoglutarate dehydrogenase E1 component [Alicyclobacillus acidiphilus]|uniref:2-oxoglutarate dehydrogenase E1 component n=1 Tax=Alicyclobacillus acidiphilus TaxID=182455 RepID=UPI000834FB52|nr:2-oxoglutarate dehydrogenase E1 component [Alicyclobacillus acidiphilus]